MPVPQKFLKFALSGGMAIVFNIALLYVFVTWLGIWYLSASAFAFILSVLAHFILQKLWVFVDKGVDGVHVQFLKFCALAFVNLAINSVCLYVLVSLLGLNYLIAQTILRVGLAIMNYFFYEVFVFTNDNRYGKL